MKPRNKFLSKLVIGIKNGLNSFKKYIYGFISFNLDEDEPFEGADLSAFDVPKPVMTDKKCSADKGMVFIKENPIEGEKDAMVQDIIEEYSGTRRFRAYFFDKLNPDYFDVEYGDTSLLKDMVADQISDDSCEYIYGRRSQDKKRGKHLVRRKFEGRF